MLIAFVAFGHRVVDDLAACMSHRELGVQVSQVTGGDAGKHILGEDDLSAKSKLILLAAPASMCSGLTTSLPSKLVLAGKATLEHPRPRARLCDAAGGP